MIVLWIFVFLVLVWIKNDLEETEKAEELKKRIEKASQEKLLKRYLLSILCYRTVKPGPSNYPCQYLEWASGVKLNGFNKKRDETQFVFYGKPEGEEDQLYVIGVGEQVDKNKNYAPLLGISDSGSTTFSALAVDLNGNGYLDLIVARSNGVWLYQHRGLDYHIADTSSEVMFYDSGGICIYAQEKLCEPYALALAEFGMEGQEVGHPVKVHLTRCVNPRWIKPVVVSGYSPHQKVKPEVDPENGQVLEENVVKESFSNDSSLMSSAVVDLTPGYAEPFYTDSLSGMSIGRESHEFGVDPTKLDFKINEYENFFDLYKDQILARSDRSVKYFMLREDGKTFIPDFKDKIIKSKGNEDTGNEVYGSENDLFWIELIKNYYNSDKIQRLRVGLPSEEEMNGAEVFYGSQNYKLTDASMDVAEFEDETQKEKGQVLSVVTRLGSKYQLLNPKTNCQYQLCSRWEPNSESLAKMT